MDQVDDFMERRKHLRIPIAARVKSKESDEESIWMTKNISEGGLFLMCENPPFAGTNLTLEISLPNVDDLLKIKGQVVWRLEGEGFGVEFTRVTAAQKKILDEFLNMVDFLNQESDSKN